MSKRISLTDVQEAIYNRYLRGEFTSIYCKECGNDDTYLDDSVKQKFRSYLASLTSVSLDNGPKIFQDFMTKNKSYHEFTPAARAERLINSIASETDDYSRYMAWRVFFDAFVTSMEKLEILAIQVRNNPENITQTNRKIESIINDFEPLASQVDKRFDRLRGKIHGPLVVIMGSQLAAMREIRTPALILSAEKSSKTVAYKVSNMLLESLKEFNDPFAWVKKVYVGLDETDKLCYQGECHEIGVKVNVAEHTPSVTPENPSQLRSTIDQIVLLAAHAGKEDDPVTLDFGWNKEKDSITIDIHPFARLFRHPIWKKIEKTLHAAGVKFSKENGNVIRATIPREAVTDEFLTLNIQAEKNETTQAILAKERLKKWRKLLVKFLDEAANLYPLLSKWLRSMGRSNHSLREETTSILQDQIKKAKEAFNKARTFAYNEISLQTHETFSSALMFVQDAKNANFANSIFYLSDPIQAAFDTPNDPDALLEAIEVVDIASESLKALFNFEYINTTYANDPSIADRIEFRLPKTLPAMSWQRSLAFRAILDKILAEAMLKADESIMYPAQNLTNRKLLSILWDSDSSRLIVNDISGGLGLFSAFYEKTIQGQSLTKGEARCMLESLAHRLNGGGIELFFNSSYNYPDTIMIALPEEGNIPPRGNFPPVGQTTGTPTPPALPPNFRGTLQKGSLVPMNAAFNFMNPAFNSSAVIRGGIICRGR